MLSFRNVVIKNTEVKEGQFDDKKGKYVKFKKPKTIVKTVFDDDFVCDIGELYEVLKFNSEKNTSGTISVTFETDLQY
tara:strand:- start:308 stop:541 length:234 start_codon:yes stop_codon:yes gene_type:complete